MKLGLFLIGLLILIGIPYAPGAEPVKGGLDAFFHINNLSRLSFLVFISILIWIILFERLKVQFSLESLLFICFLLFLLISGSPSFPVLKQIKTTFVTVLLIFLCWILTFNIIEKVKHIEKVINIFIVLGLIHASTGFLQLVSSDLFSGTLERYFFVLESQYGRITGIWGNGPVFASFIVMCTPFIYHKILLSNSFIGKILSIALLLISVILIIQSGSRAPAFVFFIISILFLIRFKKGRKIFYYFVVPLIFIILYLTFIEKIEVPSELILFERVFAEAETGQTSGLSRLVIYSQSLSVWLDNMLTGIGFQQWFTSEYFTELASVTTLKAVHSALLQILIETGILGMVSFLILVFFQFRNGIRIIRSNKNSIVSNYMFTFLLGSSAIILCSIVDSPLSLNPFIFAFWLIFSVIQKLTILSSDSTKIVNQVNQ